MCKKKPGTRCTSEPMKSVQSSVRKVQDLAASADSLFTKLNSGELSQAEYDKLADQHHQLIEVKIPAECKKINEKKLALLATNSAQNDIEAWQSKSSEMTKNAGWFVSDFLDSEEKLAKQAKYINHFQRYADTINDKNDHIVSQGQQKQGEILWQFGTTGFNFPKQQLIVQAKKNLAVQLDSINNAAFATEENKATALAKAKEAYADNLANIDKAYTYVVADAREASKKLSSGQNPNSQHG